MNNLLLLKEKANTMRLMGMLLVAIIFWTLVLFSIKFKKLLIKIRR